MWEATAPSPVNRLGPSRIRTPTRHFPPLSRFKSATTLCDGGAGVAEDRTNEKENGYRGSSRKRLAVQSRSRQTTKLNELASVEAD
ncbi:hypothetical protein GWI33_016432 [Rhynchophorus ferrugineus]|uniref:Uncharacterized protein n=1 Tax=Rhynchophorus ferrugineus TaxID=354439 RepID=A0A834I1S2_RHYFE|nr:hypothetical protein GWI33_016432 [Rhynchophorus ferrugineus]